MSTLPSIFTPALFVCFCQKLKLSWSKIGKKEKKKKKAELPQAL